MLYLLLAILSSAMISFIMRLSTDKISANLSMLTTNYLVCSLLGAVYGGFKLVMPQAEGFSVTWSAAIAAARSRRSVGTGRRGRAHQSRNFFRSAFRTGRFRRRENERFENRVATLALVFVNRHCSVP